MPLYNHWITEETKDGVERREPLRLPQGGGSGEWKWIVRDFGNVMYIMLHLKRITNKNLLYSTWNSAQCYVPAWMEAGSWRRMGICICMTESLHSSPKTTTTLLIGYTPIQNKRFKVWGKKKNIYITEHYQCLFLNNKIIFHLLFLLFYSLQVFKNKINFVIMEIYFNKCSNIFIFKVLQCLKYDIPILFLMVMPTRCSHKPKENICNASVALILGVSFPIEFLQSSKMHANNIL